MKNLQWPAEFAIPLFLRKSSVNHVQIVNYAAVPEIGIAIGIGIEKNGFRA